MLMLLVQYSIVVLKVEVAVSQVGALRRSWIEERARSERSTLECHSCACAREREWEQRLLVVVFVVVACIHRLPGGLDGLSAQLLGY